MWYLVLPGWLVSVQGSVYSVRGPLYSTCTLYTLVQVPCGTTCTTRFEGVLPELEGLLPGAEERKRRRIYVRHKNPRMTASWQQCAATLKHIPLQMAVLLSQNKECCQPLCYPFSNTVLPLSFSPFWIEWRIVEWFHLSLFTMIMQSHSTLCTLWFSTSVLNHWQAQE